MGTTVPEMRRGRDMKGVSTVSVAGVHEILPEFVRRNRRQIFSIIEKIDAKRRIRLVLVPGPAGNLVAVGAFDRAGAVGNGGSADVPGKDEKTEADEIKCDGDGGAAPERTVAPELVRFVPARKNVEGTSSAA